MKIVQMVPELESGGVERGTVELACFLASEGHEAVVVSGGGRMVRELEECGARHVGMPVGRKSPKSLALVPKLRRRFAEEAPDIVHLASRVPAWTGWLAWRKMDPQARPRLVTAVHGFHSVNRWSEIMTRGERVICVSESIRRYVLENYPRARAENLRVVLRGIDPAEYPHGYRPPPAWTERFFSQFPEARGKRLLTLPGRITRLKGHRDLLEILKTLPDEDIHALIVGGTHPKRRDYHKGLLAAIADAGLENRVTFTGARTDLREILAISSVVLSLSRQPESFGRTTLEALGLGRPVAGYDHGGVAEILAVLLPEGRVPPGDTARAAAVIRRFLGSPPEIPDSHPFTLEAMLKGTLDVYRELLGQTS